MSESMDLEKSLEILKKNDIHASCWPEYAQRECNVLYDISKALASERQRMIEKFRPVAKAFDQLANPYVRHQCTHGILLDSVWFQGAQEAIAKWKEIEKECK